MSGDDYGGNKYQREGSVRLHSTHTGELMLESQSSSLSAGAELRAPTTSILLHIPSSDSVNRQAYVGTTKSSRCYSMLGHFVKEIHFKVKGAPQDRVAGLRHIANQTTWADVYTMR
jgi:hypothetical protein